VGRVGNRYVWQGENLKTLKTRVGKRKKNFGALRRILPTLAWNPAGAPAWCEIKLCITYNATGQIRYSDVIVVVLFVPAVTEVVH